MTKQSDSLNKFNKRTSIYLNHFENFPLAKGQQNKFKDFEDKNGQGTTFCTIKKNFSTVLFVVEISQCA